MPTNEEALAAAASAVDADLPVLTAFPAKVNTFLGTVQPVIDDVTALMTQMKEDAANNAALQTQLAAANAKYDTLRGNTVTFINTLTNLSQQQIQACNDFLQANP